MVRTIDFRSGYDNVSVEVHRGKLNGIRKSLSNQRHDAASSC